MIPQSKLKIIVLVTLTLATIIAIIWIYLQPPELDPTSVDKINVYLQEHGRGLPEIPTK